MTVMETDESDEYPKTVWAPQILKFFNISDQIHSMYQLIQYASIPIWSGNIRKHMAAFSGTELEMEGRVGMRAHFRKKILKYIYVYRYILD